MDIARACALVLAIAFLIKGIRDVAQEMYGDMDSGGSDTAKNPLLRFLRNALFLFLSIPVFVIFVALVFYHDAGPLLPYLNPTPTINWATPIHYFFPTATPTFTIPSP